MSLHITDSVIWQENAGGVSLYHTETGEFLTLNDTGAQIWVLVAGDGEREQVATRLCLLFGGGNAVLGARIRSEVNEFIDAMVRGGMLAENAAA